MLCSRPLAGLVKEYGSAVGKVAGEVGTVGFRGVVQGGVQQLLGGSFRDGAVAGAVGALAETVSADVLDGISQLPAGTLSGAQVTAANAFARVLGSAIRAAANPDNPGHAFASAFLDDVLKQVDPGPLGDGGAAGDTSAADARGATSPYAPGAQAPAVIDIGVVPIPSPFYAAPDLLVPQDRFVPDADHDRAVADLNAELGIDPLGLPPALDDSAWRDPASMPVGWGGDNQPSAAEYAQRLASRVGGELRGLFERGVSAANKALSYGDISQLETVKVDIQTYLDARAERGGLSEAEIVLFGTLYAATETLFPTNVADFAGGVGKGLAATGAVVSTGRGADVLAATARAASVEQAVARHVKAVEQAAHARGMEVVREVPGSRGQWNDALSGALKPGAVYLLDNGHAYMTDALGRVAKTESVLDVKRMDRNTYQQLMAGKVGGEGYDGGHLIGSLLGGAGERINLVPQLATINRGEYREMERAWAEAIRAGKEVKVEINPIYSGTSKVPDLLDVSYWIDGQLTISTFSNVKGD